MYTIYSTQNTPQFLLDRHQRPAMYTVGAKSFYVFGDDDINDETLDDIASNGFNHVFNAENKGLTIAQLKSNVNSRISNRESFKLSQAQGRYMWEEEWKPNQTED